MRTIEQIKCEYGQLDAKIKLDAKINIDEIENTIKSAYILGFNCTACCIGNDKSVRTIVEKELIDAKYDYTIIEGSPMYNLIVYWSNDVLKHDVQVRQIVKSFLLDKIHSGEIKVDKDKTIRYFEAVFNDYENPTRVIGIKKIDDSNVRDVKPYCTHIGDNKHLHIIYKLYMTDDNIMIR